MSPLQPAVQRSETESGNEIAIETESETEDGEMGVVDRSYQGRHGWQHLACADDGPGEDWQHVRWLPRAYLPNERCEREPILLQSRRMGLGPFRSAMAMACCRPLQIVV